MPAIPDDLPTEPQGERPLDKVNLSGELLGPYQLQSLLSDTPFFQLYRGVEAGLEQPVAVKVLKPGDWLRSLKEAALRQELRLLAGLRHPNLIRLLYIGEIRGYPALVLEYVNGRSLARHARGRKLAVREVLPLLLRISRAVGAAHEQQLLHRNLNPDNVLFETSVHDPELQTLYGFVKVADFGITRLFRGFEECAVTHQPERLRYLAPEQIAGRQNFIGPATDVHAIGLLGWELLTGKPAYSSFPRISDQLRHVPPPLGTQVSRIPAALSRLIDRCLEKNPIHRYPDANVVADELARIREQLLIESLSAPELTGLKDSDSGMSVLTATDLVALPAPAAPPESNSAPPPPRFASRWLLLALLTVASIAFYQFVLAH